MNNYFIIVELLKEIITENKLKIVNVNVNVINNKMISGYKNPSGGLIRRPDIRPPESGFWPLMFDSWKLRLQQKVKVELNKAFGFNWIGRESKIAISLPVWDDVIRLIH